MRLVASFWAWDHEHLTRFMMIVIMSGVSVFWWSRLRETIDMGVPWTTTATALLLCSSVWLAVAYVVLTFDEDHGVSTAVILRPVAALYFLAACWRTWLYRHVISGLLRARDEVQRHVE